MKLLLRQYKSNMWEYALLLGFKGPVSADMYLWENGSLRWCLQSFLDATVAVSILTPDYSPTNQRKLCRPFWAFLQQGYASFAN